MTKRAAFVYDDALAEHTLSEEHPMKPIRLRYTYELLRAYGALDVSGVTLVKPRKATREEILSYHTLEYVNAVQMFSNRNYSTNLAKFNFGPGDNPVYEGMYQAASLSSGASMRSVELLTSGAMDAVFSISGGLHHAMPGYASGFCVFNDAVMAIKALLSSGMRVAYVDIDCHHGDGVQHAFYATDDVLTISLHESGTFLFPGTGFVEDMGGGKGRGYSVNLPLYPYTTDEVYLWAFREIVPPLLRAFRPDVLVTQQGVDSHYLDPITHLALTVQGFGQVVSEFPELAPKWLALGGGGYDLQAVARSWALAFAIMSEQALPEEIPLSYTDNYRVTNLFDNSGLSFEASLYQDARLFAEAGVKAIKNVIFPIHNVG